MSVIITAKHHIPSNEITERVFYLSPSAVAGQGYITGGDTANFAQALAGDEASGRILPGSPVPVDGEIEITKVPIGYTAEVVPAAVNPTWANCLLKIWSIATAAELAQANYPAGLAGKVIVVRIRSRKKNG